VTVLKFLIDLDLSLLNQIPHVEILRKLVNAFVKMFVNAL